MKNIILLYFFFFACLSIIAQSTSPRQTIPFDGDWQFRKAPVENSQDTSWQQVKIPHTWNNVDMQTGKNFYAGDAFLSKAILR